MEKDLEKNLNISCCFHITTRWSELTYSWCDLHMLLVCSMLIGTLTLIG
jgi:hypothetical protein